MVPRVAMKGGRPNFATSPPFRTPTSRQQNTVTPAATQGFIPLVISVADSMQLIPATEPIDRSMLPVISTYDCPMPIRSMGAIWRSRLPTFLLEKKTGFRKPKTAHRMTKPAAAVSTCPIPLAVRARSTLEVSPVPSVLNSISPRDE